MSEGAAATRTSQQETRRPAEDSASPWQHVRARLRGNTLVPLLVVGAAVLAVVLALLLWAGSPDYRVLYSNLEEADGGQLLSELESRGVPYRLSEGGRAILVPGDQVDTLRLQLAEQGLPRASNVGFELMDSQAFGISQFAEQINFQRSLEGELTRSIESLGPVSRARVHLSMARESVFVRDREPAKASVVLTLHGGRSLGTGQVEAIVHMVSSSVPELAAEQVTVIDQGGRLLSRQQGEDHAMDGTLLSYARQVERSYQERIERILAPLYGSRNVRAQVTAQLDFTRREETAERYAPNQTPGTAAVRSLQNRVDYDDGAGLARGIPGALSNTPPGTLPSPVEIAPETDDEGEGEGENEGDADNAAAPTRLSQDNVVNYEVDRTVSHTQHQRGQIERLSVAVVVNHREVVSADGELELQPLSADEVDQVDRLVRQAMGFSVARGDQLEVINSPFSAQEENPALPWWQTPEGYRLLMALVRYLLVGWAAVMLYWFILRPLLRRHLASAERAPGAATRGSNLNVTVGDDEADVPAGSTTPAATTGEKATQATEAARREARERRRKASPYAEQLEELKHLADDDPKLVAMVLRSWLKKDDHDSAHDQPEE